MSIIVTLPVKDFFQILSSHTGIKSETLFTVCTTLFVFSAGILSNWIIKRQNTRVQRKNYRKTVNLLLKNLENLCRRQYIRSMKEIDNFSLLDSKSIAVSQHINPALPLLNKMDYSIFLSSYIRGCRQKLKIKAASKVFTLIAIANVLEKDNEDKFNLFMASIRPMQDSYIRNMLLLEQYQRGLPLKEFKDFTLKIELLEIFAVWNEKHADNNFKTSFTHLISPLLRLLQRYPLEPQLDDISKICQECHFCYSEISHNDKHINDHLRNFIHQNKRISKILSVILRIFKS